jgi:hypothetical protein
MTEVNKSKSETAKLPDTNTPPSFLTICKTEVLNYLRTGYDRWHNYAEFRNQNNGEMATNVLNEVIFDVIQKPVQKLYELLLTSFENYTELDMLILKTIENKSINKSIN